MPKAQKSRWWEERLLLGCDFLSYWTWIYNSCSGWILKIKGSVLYLFNLPTPFIILCKDENMYLKTTLELKAHSQHVWFGWTTLWTGVRTKVCADQTNKPGPLENESLDPLASEPWCDSLHWALLHKAVGPLWSSSYSCTMYSSLK